ncbi:hypothetical protein [Psychroserpens luteus]|uniref:Uncharacterized protein n=1 Tax=Psychroserpens luteus TaxID=1434066 RepID=A0ABW5ZTZ6_9FLAO|nr:hypothetical protein [Psychroserpens luteus]
MNYLPDHIIFAFGLLFRVCFYTLLITLMFFEEARQLKTKYNKIVNIGILFFGICYLGSVIPMYLDGKDYGGTSGLMITIWSMFFLYILIYNNHSKYKFELQKKASYIIVRVFIVVILFCSAQLNYHSYNGTWYGDYESEIFHGYLSILLPIAAHIFSSLKPKSANLGWFVVLVTMLQFLYGISLSYGIDGYISDDTELSVIFILNIILFFIVGIYNIYSAKNFKKSIVL